MLLSSLSYSFGVNDLYGSEMRVLKYLECLVIYKTFNGSFYACGHADCVLRVIKIDVFCWLQKLCRTIKLDAHVLGSETVGKIK